MKNADSRSMGKCRNAPIPTACRLVTLVCLSALASCQGTVPTYGYIPVGERQAFPATQADADCRNQASQAKRAAAADIWAQGGEPAYHEAYRVCMLNHGWKRVVTSLHRYG